MLEGQLQRIHQSVSIEGLVDPLSGMVLNLKVVDEIQKKVLQKIKTEFSSAFDLIDQLKAEWSVLLTPCSVSLAKIEISPWPYQKTIIWSKSSVSKMVRYQIASQFREPKKVWSGVSSVEFLASAQINEMATIIEEIGSTDQILQKLKQKFPQAQSVEFTDEVMGQKWSLSV